MAGKPTGGTTSGNCGRRQKGLVGPALADRKVTIGDETAKVHALRARIKGGGGGEPPPQPRCSPGSCCEMDRVAPLALAQYAGPFQDAAGTATAIESGEHGQRHSGLAVLAAAQVKPEVTSWRARVTCGMDGTRWRSSPAERGTVADPCPAVPPGNGTGCAAPDGPLKSPGR